MLPVKLISSAVKVRLIWERSSVATLLLSLQSHLHIFTILQGRLLIPTNPYTDR